jgi:hypothetical protein
VDETGAPMGPHRVWLQYAWIPGLAMSRALGDVLAHQVGAGARLCAGLCADGLVGWWAGGLMG